MIALNVKYLTGLWKRILRYKLGNVICINKIARPLSTVNPKFVKLYSELKGDWWDENGPLHILHMYNPLRIQFVKDGLISAGFKIQDSNLPLKGAQILEVGCGGGLVTEGLARLGAQVTGIDVSTNAIDIARKHIKLNPDISERVNYIQTTIEDFVQTERETYDAVTMFEIIQEVADLQLFIKECVKTVKPGKSVFITSINKTLASWLTVIVGYEYIFRTIGHGLEWNKLILSQEVQRILENHGCETKLINGARYNPLTKRFKWCSSTALYAIHAIKQKETGA